jgi:hypothetical protein
MIQTTQRKRELSRVEIIQVKYIFFYQKKKRERVEP